MPRSTALGIVGAATHQDRRHRPRQQTRRDGLCHDGHERTLQGAHRSARPYPLKEEVSRNRIVVYEPYLADSADERMFRAVRDRERWFQIVMGQKLKFDEATSEELANRVLPNSLRA